ncbi:MAG TPA: SDR family oxidoreductase, partial [Planctomycetota bacterium]|nr:SDR family oxidoreductase [Planctomycetota bacterium]
GRRREEGEAVAGRIRAAGGEATFVRADVSNPDDVAALVARAVETYGRLDVAFNNAGIEGDVFVLTHQQTPENYRNVFDVNVRGVLDSMRAEIPAMLANGGGVIVNNASVAGLVGFGGMALYSASKHAVVGLTRNAALEYAQQGIRANAIAPGPIETDMYTRFASPEVQALIRERVPLGRPGRPEEIANAVLWLADPGNTYTTGQVLAVDGGYTAQ